MDVRDRRDGGARRPGEPDVRAAGMSPRVRQPGAGAVRMLFLFAPAGHELYLAEMGGLISRPTPPDQATIRELRARYDIEQLTPVVPGRR
jgi:hypothetical protein